MSDTTRPPLIILAWFGALFSFAAASRAGDGGGTIRMVFTRAEADLCGYTHGIFCKALELKGHVLAAADLLEPSDSSAALPAHVPGKRSKRSGSTKLWPAPVCCCARYRVCLAQFLLMKT